MVMACKVMLDEDLDQEALEELDQKITEIQSG